MPNIKLKILNQEGQTLVKSEMGQNISLVHLAEYCGGDWIALEADVPGLYCVVQFEDSMPPTLIYIKGNCTDYSIPPVDNRTNHSPKSFIGGRHLIRARLATATEINARRNLVLNPYDAHGEHGFYPHAVANVETRNEAVFAARNAIDGIYENCSHGKYPYQSWGINRNPDAELKLEFGRTVFVDEVRLTLRADFPHDSYWVKAVLAFSDGSQETILLERSATPQKFPFIARITESVVLKNLIKAEDTSPFPALTQIECWGTEVLK